MPTIHHAISFGPYCRARYQLKRVFRAVNSSGVFDWQITPPTAVLAYLENNFTGMFEIDDLTVDLETHTVVNRTFGTRHVHEFPASVTPETLYRYYDRARRRHDYLSGKLRTLLQGRAPVLIAMAPGSEAPEAVNIRRLEMALQSYNPRGNYHLMVEPPEGSIDGTDWRGNNEVWDAALRPYKVPARTRLRAELQRLLRPRLANLPRYPREASA